jgi:small-conductance mechanosensitive channel
MRISTGAKVLVLLALSIALLIGVESLLVKYLPPFYGILRADIREALYRPYFQIGDLPVTPVFLVKALLFFLLLGLLSGAMRRVLQNKVLVRTALDEGQRYSLGQITGYAVFLFGLRWSGFSGSG